MKQAPLDNLADRLERLHASLPATIAGHRKDKCDVCALGVEIGRLNRLINSPFVEAFLEGVQREAAHQKAHWGQAHDRSKSAENWYWLVGFLAGKACRSSIEGNKGKALHHTISAAAALMCWHESITLDESNRGLGQDADLARLEGTSEVTQAEYEATLEELKDK